MNLRYLLSFSATNLPGVRFVHPRTSDRLSLNVESTTTSGGWFNVNAAEKSGYLLILLLNKTRPYSIKLLLLTSKTLVGVTKPDSPREIIIEKTQVKNENITGKY